MSSNSVRPKQSRPTKRNLYTPSPVQLRVVARSMKGESKRKIAREENLDRSTIDRILTKEEVILMVAEQQSALQLMGPLANVAIRKALTCDDLRLAAATAIKMYEGIGVMDKRGLIGVIDDAAKKSPLEFDEKVLKKLFGTVPPELRKKSPK